MEIYLVAALIYMLYENWSLRAIISQLRHNQRNYIEMLTSPGSDTINDKY